MKKGLPEEVVEEGVVVAEVEVGNILHCIAAYFYDSSLQERTSAENTV